MSRVKLWQGDPTQRLTVILPARLAMDLKIEALRRGVDVSVLAAQAFAACLDPQAPVPAPPPAPAPAPAGSIRRQAEVVRRGRELAGRLKAAFASGRITLAEFSRHLARAIGHPNPVGLSSAVRQWRQVPERHQPPVEHLLDELDLDPGSPSALPGPPVPGRPDEPLYP